MATWDDFFVAQVGASAALAGLVFVGLSINMAKIVANASLPNRALQAVTLLFSILIVASVQLVPGQSLPVLGLEVVGIGIGFGAVTARVTLNSLRRVAPEYRRWHVLESSVAVAAPVLYVGAGLALLLGRLSGNYLIVPAFLICFVVAIIDAWVLLVEINR